MSFFNNPVALGNLSLKNRVFLAPLAGVSDIPFRRICQELGAGLTYVEMLSATAISYKNKRTFEMMARHKSESLLGVQVTGSNAALVAEAVSVLDKQGFETIDINMGCPVRKVVGAGCGSAILKEPTRITETVSLARQATTKPLSAKFRLGYTREDINVNDTAKRVVSGAVDMFTIHGRTRSENYSKPCDLMGIKNGVQSGKDEFKSLAVVNKKMISVGNGDVFCFSSADKMQKETDCDAVMVSRGALGNPWVFTEILAGHTVNPTFAEWLEVVLRHLSYQEEHYGNTQFAAILARKFLIWYAKGFPGSKALREAFGQILSIDNARTILNNYATSIPKDFVRYSGSHSEITSAYDPKYEMDRVLDRGVGEEDL